VRSGSLFTARGEDHALKPGERPEPDYRAVFNALPGKNLLLAPDFTILGVSDSYLAATMTRRESILGRGLFEVFPDNPNDPAADGVRNLRASLERVIAQRRRDRMALQKYDIRRPEHAGGGFEERYWSPLNSPVLGPDGQVRCIIHTVEDVTEVVRLRQEMQHELLTQSPGSQPTAGPAATESFLQAEALAANRRLTESERRYRFLADTVPQLIWSADAKGNLDYCNERWFAFTELPFERLRGVGWQDTLHPDDRERVVAAWEGALQTGALHLQIEHRMRHRDGTWRWMLTTALPFHDDGRAVTRWFGTTTDIHDRMLADEQMRQAQRLQAVGKLAGGVAHEVNNMMTVVLGLGEMALSSMAPDDPHQKDVADMMKAGMRASEVTRQLLAFSRQQVLQPTVLDVDTVVHELAPVLRRLLGSDRHLDVRTAKTRHRIMADRGQIEQVLINLVVNARDATGTDGQVTVETEEVVLDRPTLSSHNESEAAPGRYVRLAVRDNGSGMDPDVVARAFEPFFTTKAVGHGTGLGLSMVYGIVKQSGGYVRIESATGKGSTMNIYLPAVDAELTAAEAPVVTPRGRGELILVVDDEPMLRTLAERALQADGYRVSLAPNGGAALEYLRSHAGAVDLVLTDIVMPKLNGRELSEKISMLYPRIRVLFMSGYSGDEIQHRGLMLAGVPFVQKPFTRQSLATAVRSLLDRS
jgi:PAS domain S-box-containing protein